MKKTIILSIAFIVISSVAWASETTRSNIERVEKGLRPSLLVANVPGWSIEERMAHYKVPGVSIAVIKDFELQWAKGYGVVDANTNHPVTERTLFQAASISKPIAATVALYLVQKGILDLDSDVNDKLESWKVPENEFTRNEKVTLRRLLSHTAGLTVSGFRGYSEGEPVPTILEVLDGIRPSNTPPIRVDIEPGTKFKYSGGGYTVLQLLVEDVTGAPFSETARELIFEPLGMAHSSFQKPLPQTLAPLVSSAHSKEGKPFKGHWYLSEGSICCGLLTTPTDLVKYAIEIQKSLRGESNKILSADMVETMLTSSGLGDAGLGLFLYSRDGAVYFQHGGGNEGFRCYLIAHRDEGYGAAIMTNADNGSSLMPEILRSIAREYDWKNYLPEEYESFDAVVEVHRKKAMESPNDPDVSEENLNRIGYELLAMEAYKQSIALFTLNTELYPKSANCYDSLAETYWKSGDIEKAITHFQEALEILEQYPEINKRYEHLKERIPKILEQLKGSE